MSGDAPAPPPQEPVGQTPPPAPTPPAPPAQGSTFGGASSLPSNKEMVNRLQGDVLGVVAAGLAVSTFLWSFLPYYTASVNFMGISQSDSVSAWHGFFGWAAMFLAVAAAAVLLAAIVGIELPVPAGLAALGLLGVSLLFLIIALFVIPGGDCGGVAACEDAVDFGHGVGYWLSLLAVLGATGITATRVRKA
mgnify:CR=1 FL=1